MSIFPPLLVGTRTTSGLISDASMTLSMVSISCSGSTKKTKFFPFEQKKDLYFLLHLDLEMRTCVDSSQFDHVENNLLNQLSA